MKKITGVLLGILMMLLLPSFVLASGTQSVYSQINGNTESVGDTGDFYQVLGTGLSGQVDQIKLKIRVISGTSTNAILRIGCSTATNYNEDCGMTDVATGLTISGSTQIYTFDFGSPYTFLTNRYYTFRFFANGVSIRVWGSSVNTWGVTGVNFGVGGNCVTYECPPVIDVYFDLRGPSVLPPPPPAAPLSLRLPFRGGESWFITQGNGEGSSHQNNEYYSWDFNKVGTTCNGDKGEPVFAPASGKITHAGFFSAAWGNIIRIDYGNGKFGKITHVLNDQTYPIKVKVGQYVFQGEIIGYNGDTGTSSGGCAHIHYQTENASGVSLDPIVNNIKFIDPDVIVRYPNGVPEGCNCDNDNFNYRYISSNTTPSPVYHLDTLNDSSNNGNNITFQSACLVQGCVTLNGTTDEYLEALNSSSLQNSGDMSIIFWLKPENIGIGRINPIDKAYFGEFSLVLETDGSLSYYHGQNIYNYFNWMALTPGSIANTQGVRIVITRDNTAKIVKSYVNGDLISTASYGVDPSVSINPLRIGLGNTNIPYKGKIDEIAVYPRVLTDNEVNNEFYGSKP